MPQRMLIAGVGNIFLGDDGFGVEVAKRLATEPLPDWVRVADFGIRGIHLAYELLEQAYDTTILVDATWRGGKPGTVYLIEAHLETFEGQAYGSPEAHGMHPEAVFELLRTLGGSPGRVFIVGCEPAGISQGIGLSAPALQAVEDAVRLIVDLVRQEGSAGSVTQQPCTGENDS